MAHRLLLKVFKIILPANNATTVVKWCFMQNDRLRYIPFSNQTLFFTSNYNTVVQYLWKNEWVGYFQISEQMEAPQHILKRVFGFLSLETSYHITIHRYAHDIIVLPQYYLRDIHAMFGFAMVSNSTSGDVKS